MYRLFTVLQFICCSYDIYNIYIIVVLLCLLITQKKNYLTNNVAIVYKQKHNKT